MNAPHQPCIVNYHCLAAKEKCSVVSNLVSHMLTRQASVYFKFGTNAIASKQAVSGKQAVSVSPTRDGTYLCTT